MSNTKSRTFKITYRIPNTNRPAQETIIQASDPNTAMKLLTMQFPGVKIVSAPREIKNR